MISNVAALYVDPRGPYPKLVEHWWDEKRDARTYAGPWPVVAHPPCARWCRLAKFVEYRNGLAVGSDGGTFARALACVREFGGVLEHPAWSLAWGTHGLIAPPARGWHRNTDGTWCCEVSQAAYGHAARKLTWLYFVGPAPTPARWDRPTPTAEIGHGMHKRRNYPRIGDRAASLTPLAFAEWLISLAATAERRAA